MIIFNLDGTLANCEHRRHFVQPYEKRWVDEEKYYGPKFRGQSGYACLKKDGSLFDKPDWKSFYEACDKDEPNIPVCQTINNFLLESMAGELLEEIQIWSGRCESVRIKTHVWLSKYTNFLPDRDILKMRPEGDSTPDDILKEKWLDEAIAQGKNINFVFDDRPKVIRIWRRRGIFVFNCCQHDREF